MATDSTELTFVRCPSCRSLVPAVSSRCRMCSAPLGGGAENKEASAGGAPARSPSEAASSTRNASADGGDTSVDTDDLIDDPLGDYLDDLDTLDDVSGNESDDSEDEDFADVPEVREAQNGNGKAPDPLLGGDSHEDDDELIDPLFGEEEELEPLDEVPEPQQEKKVAPRVRLESGGKRRSGLSFRKKREASARPTVREGESKRKPEAVRIEPSRTLKERTVKTSAGSSAREHRAAETRHNSDIRETVPTTKVASNGRARDTSTEHNGVPEDHVMEEREFNRALERAPSPLHEKRAELEGRLFGWLVSFQDPDGEAIELREGKFFITGSPLKENDLVLEEPGISTPHALVSVTQERGLLVQDLMSERGVFVRGLEDAAYQKEEETIRLEHGDWVRFGDREFLITLIPQARNRH
ncbi:MAG: FHA domain-containing protein [Bdellovibrionales bacterium]|nr:FHA domain-containing protein [Bdellovibrionales bacterium]